MALLPARVSVGEPQHSICGCRTSSRAGDCSKLAPGSFGRAVTLSEPSSKKQAECSQLVPLLYYVLEMIHPGIYQVDYMSPVFGKHV